jgi:hypothetical protein
LPEGESEMSQKTLKELLKLPFHNSNTDDSFRIFVANESRSVVTVQDFLFHIKKGKDKIDHELFHEFCKWVTAALNEKAERDFGEPMRWVNITDEFINPTITHLRCPKCARHEIRDDVHYCPSCGQRLLPPKEK